MFYVVDDVDSWMVTMDTCETRSPIETTLAPEKLKNSYA